MKRKHQLRLWLAWINIPIGLLYVYLIFSFFPMSYVILGTIFTFIVVSVRPTTSISSFILAYWVIFSVLLSFGTQAIWWPILFEPFRDLNGTFGQGLQNLQLLFVLI